MERSRFEGASGAAFPSSFGNTLTEQEQQINYDYEWCLHDPAVQRAHGGKAVAVHCRRIWGIGANHLDALQAALREPGCPPRSHLAVVVVPELAGAGQTLPENGENG